MVKVILKNNSVTLSEFADVIRVSRPTLDSYIKSFDYNGYLTNSLYNNVFTFLFSDLSIKNDDFAEKYAYIKRFFGKKAVENSNEFLSGEFSSVAKVDNNSVNSALKYKIIDLIGNSEFPEEVLTKVLNDLQNSALCYSLVKEFEKYAFYHETIEDTYYFVFKAGTNIKKDNTIKIDGQYHYVVYKSANYDDICSFIKDMIGEEVL